MSKEDSVSIPADSRSAAAKGESIVKSAAAKISEHTWSSPTKYSPGKCRTLDALNVEELEPPESAYKSSVQ